ncbi:MAG TPA: hypothetical protein VF746_23970 [Longimicrobium sp.]|jgi:hypothetical protein
MNPAWKQKQEEFDEAEYDPDLLELKRCAEEAGVKVQIPKRGGGRGSSRSRYRSTPT